VLALSSMLLRASVLLRQTHQRRRSRLGPADLPNTATTRTEWLQWHPVSQTRAFGNHLGGGPNRSSHVGHAASSRTAPCICPWIGEDSAAPLGVANTRGVASTWRGIRGIRCRALGVSVVLSMLIVERMTTQVSLDGETGAQHGELHVLSPSRGHLPVTVTRCMTCHNQPASLPTQYPLTVLTCWMASHTQGVSVELKLLLNLMLR
jgi:hypothetical protein